MARLKASDSVDHESHSFSSLSRRVLADLFNRSCPMKGRPLTEFLIVIVDHFYREKGSNIPTEMIRKDMGEIG